MKLAATLRRDGGVYVHNFDPLVGQAQDWARMYNCRDRDERARRIVASVNALSHMSIDEIEQVFGVRDSEVRKAKGVE